MRNLPLKANPEIEIFLFFTTKLYVQPLADVSVVEKLSHAGLEPHRRESAGRWTGTGTGRYFGSGSNTEHSLAMYIEARAHRITTLLMTSVATFPNHHHLCPERKRARADDHAQSYSTAATQSERDIATWGDWRLSHSVEWIRKLKFIESTFLCI